MGRDRTQRWLPVDQYAGGPEHVARHHLYARFVTMALHDLGLVPFAEPFPRIRLHGMLTLDGAKMTKSRGNVVNPDDLIARARRRRHRGWRCCSRRPWDADGEWDPAVVAGVERFLARVWRVVTGPSGDAGVEDVGRGGAQGHGRHRRDAVQHRDRRADDAGRPAAGCAGSAGRWPARWCRCWPRSRRTSPRSCGRSSAGRARFTSRRGPSRPISDAASESGRHGPVPGDPVDVTDDTRVFTAPLQLAYPYDRTVGPTLSRFFTGLRERRIEGTVGSDGRRYVPPAEFDPVTGVPCTEWVAAESTGTVQSWTWDPAAGNGWGLVVLDGSDVPMLHRLLVGGPDEISTGMRVTARWSTERTGGIADIDGFVPEGSDQPDRGSPARTRPRATSRSTGCASRWR